ncbi:DUF1697 domain-containing protein [Rasiella rasia]|uniref:DUF1697 domain-containing protein n=1 Tax=Rasiella rasia TaxID=2744027 RepID=A0A6G6GP04_9FLAO|nr:DUF1697 domain-containing protein [Rasiella rasia]QIE59441.1 DUF1697 domain-containing protein [Rasiella rasia]
MTQYIALLRGINVGGHKKFLKSEQLEMLAQMGFANAQVYLHTGNWIFSTSTSAQDVSATIVRAIQKKFGWEVPVLVFTTSEIEDIFNNCPFSEDVREKSYFTLLAEVPRKESIDRLQTLSYTGEEFHVTKTCVYFYPEEGAGKAKLNNNIFENKLKVVATSRNYKTMAKLIEIGTK